MNDRFRFRAWSKQLKRMVCIDEMLLFRLAEIDSDLVFEQCTGLKDKNGKLIYEGDIVKFKISSIKCVGAVRRDERTGGWLKDKTGQPLHTYIKSVEVIGNIHENPELLEDR